MDQNANLVSRPFSLMEGGPFFHILKRLGHIKMNAPYLRRRALFGALITWVPLLILSQMQGLAFGHTISVPYLSDFSGYTRF
ncbi:MAG TPA: hypothetical protein VK638_10800, partial [Edaphobacter sp.]|nr:hypothetical protein [Edaphobacter sp.]